MQATTANEVSEKLICSDCVGESYLSKYIRKNGDEETCDYCGKEAPALSIEDISGLIEHAFENHFEITATDPDGYELAMLKDRESDYNWWRSGEPTDVAIMNAADISEEASKDLQIYLGDMHSDFDSSAAGYETPFGEEVHYEEIMPSDEEWEEGWRCFEQTVKTEARFFSRLAVEQLGALFDTIDQLKTMKGQSLIVQAGPGTEHDNLYRARVFQSVGPLKDAMKRPDLELAAPPSRHASSGRMNAHGISVFYGATTPHVARAEVRPTVGSQVLIGRFDIIRPLKLLDLAALADIHETGSIFDPDYTRRLGRKRFLSKLSSRMARPVMPDDQEFEYLPTQAIADYLATESAVPVDGIMFPSVQATAPGVNVVLFHKSSHCEVIELPKNCRLDAYTGHLGPEGWEPDYSVHEHDAPDDDQRTGNQDDFLDDDFPPPFHGWKRGKSVPPTLRVDPASLEVHLIQAVEFTALKSPVRRFQSKGKLAF